MTNKKKKKKKKPMTDPDLTVILGLEPSWGRKQPAKAAQYSKRGFYHSYIRVDLNTEYCWEKKGQSGPIPSSSK